MWLSILHSQWNLQAAANVTGSAHIVLLVSFAIQKHHTCYRRRQCASRRVLQRSCTLSAFFFGTKSIVYGTACMPLCSIQSMLTVLVTGFFARALMQGTIRIGKE